MKKISNTKKKNNNYLIKGIIALLVVIGAALIVNALDNGDVTIRYSTESFGTGIAISHGSPWMPGNPANLSKNSNYDIHYNIDNKNTESTVRTHTILSLDDTVLADYYGDITTSHSRAQNLNLASLNCDSLHTIYLKVNECYDENCTVVNGDNQQDNQAQRSFSVFCAGISNGEVPITPSTCGNEVCNNGEDCSNCQADCGVCPPRCGDGTCNGEESCAICSTDCGSCASLCGDGVKQSWEQCDDGNAVNTDSCRNNCKLPSCGDGVKDTNEFCDDGNLVNGDGCSNVCKLGVCGDGNLSLGEQCDNKELNGAVCSAGYGSNCSYCSNTCDLKKIIGDYCGDGKVNTIYEKCDDGNKINNDQCTNECRRPIDIGTEDFVPLVWQCDHRVVYDDDTEPGRLNIFNKGYIGEQNNGILKQQVLLERINNYAFEGEQIQWRVLVMDKNGIDKVKDVYVTVDGGIEANCVRETENSWYNCPSNNCLTESTQVIMPSNQIDPACNARILEEQITKFDKETMAYYTCTLTVETVESMHGEAPITVEAEDLDGIVGDMDEEEFWFLNPFISIGIEGNIEFENLKEGTSGYSKSVIITNDAEYGSGVILDMFISGTDFYDPSNSGAKCPTTNQLSLNNFKYYATNGAYSTHDDSRSDSEGYVPIRYGIGFNDPNPFYGSYEIIQSGTKINGLYYAGNTLTPGADIALIFKLDLPEPCNGDFTAGQMYFWGEAI